MRRQLALFLYSYAIAIKSTWGWGNRFEATNILMALFLSFNVMTFYLFVSGNKLPQTIVPNFIPMAIWGIIFLTLSRVFNKSYMEQLQFEKKLLFKARLCLLGYAIVSLGLLIIAKVSNT